MMPKFRKKPVEIEAVQWNGAGFPVPLPDWLARRRKRSSKYDPENLNNFELLQEFEFEEGKSHCAFCPIWLLRRILTRVE